MINTSIFSLLSSISVGFIVLCIFFSLFSIAIYVANAIIMTKALTEVGYKYPWFSWIPFLKSYAIADLLKADENGLIVVGGLKFDIKVYKFYWLASLMVSSFVFFVIPVGAIVSIAINAFCGALCYKELYSNFEIIDKKNEWICYLTGIIPIIAPIKYLIYKNKKEHDEVHDSEAHENGMSEKK